MNEPAGHFEPSRTVRRFLQRWRDHGVRRLKGGDESRPPFDHDRFLAEFAEDFPWHPEAVAVEYAHLFGTDSLDRTA